MNLLKKLEANKKAKARKEKIKIVKKFAIGTTLGAIAGVVSGVLLAPKSGKETREDISKTAKDISENVKIKSIEIKDTLDAKAQQTKENIIESKQKIASYIAEKKAVKNKEEASVEAAVEVEIRE